MDFNVQTKISNFVENQFPQFYQEDGPNFILFVKAYYEWLEESGNVTKESRELFNYRDIDNTLESFLEHFQKKYLYGIPFSVIINKRYLLKHILDVYRSKSSIQCYKLLFRLIYDEDIEIYLPSRDMLRASDGKWIEPRYIEVSYSANLASLVGKQIIGSYSNTTAIVENYVKESFDSKKVYILYISNILPKGGSFDVGEKIRNIEENNDFIGSSSVLGSLSVLDITNGGQGFEVGDILKIVHTSNGNIVSEGIEGLVRVKTLSKGYGTLNFNVVDAGQGYKLDSEIFVYKNNANGSGASFALNTLLNTQTVEYNTDVICDYVSKTIDEATYNFPLTPTANLTSNIGLCFSYSNALFGGISTLTNIETGNSYTTAANVYVRSVLTSNVLPGNVSYNTTSNTVTGVSTNFTEHLSNGDVIYLKGNTSLSATIEYQMIREVTNTTSIILHGPPTNNSTPSARYAAAPVIFPSNFALYENIMFNVEGDVYGKNELITALPSSIDNKVVSELVSLDSGKGYIEGESVKAYLYGAVSNNIIINQAGNNYTNGELIIFSGGGGTDANGYITTNSTGSIVSTTLVYGGSGYTEIPNLRIRSSNGTSATLYASLETFNLTSSVTGRVVKSGIGKAKGYWATTDGFLNADKYIQDSYYYQDFSYDIKVAIPLSKYRDILYNTFHIAGTELFGQFLLIDTQSSNVAILYETSSANTASILYFRADSNVLTADINYTVDTIGI